MARTRKIAISLVVAGALAAVAVMFLLSGAFRARIWIALFECGLVNDETLVSRLASIGRPSEEAVLVWMESPERAQLGAIVYSTMPAPEHWFDAMVLAVEKSEVALAHTDQPIVRLCDRLTQEDLPRVLKLTNHPEKRVQLFAIELLARHPTFYEPGSGDGPLSLPMPSQAVVSRLRELAAAADKDERIGEAAAEALTRYVAYGGDDGCRTVSRSLNSPDPATSLAAVRLIGERGGGGWAASLLLRLWASPPDIRDSDLEDAIRGVLMDKYRDEPCVKEAMKDGRLPPPQ